MKSNKNIQLISNIAHEAEVLTTSCQKDGLMSIHELSVTKDGPIFYFEPPTNPSFGAGPLGMLMILFVLNANGIQAMFQKSSTRLFCFQCHTRLTTKV